jgi:hypothetical protein
MANAYHVDYEDVIYPAVRLNTDTTDTERKTFREAKRELVSYCQEWIEHWRTILKGNQSPKQVRNVELDEKWLEHWRTILKDARTLTAKQVRNLDEKTL